VGSESCDVFDATIKFLELSRNTCWSAVDLEGEDQLTIEVTDSCC
jgi:hypothetical protein